MDVQVLNVKRLLRDLATDLIINERIQTTEARAKELRSVVEKMITLVNVEIYMLVVKLLHSSVMKLHDDMKQIKLHSKTFC